MAFYPNTIDPDMQRIVSYCYDAGLFWIVNLDASRIEFVHHTAPTTVIASFDREEDPNNVLESLRLLTVFR